MISEFFKDAKGHMISNRTGRRVNFVQYVRGTKQTIYVPGDTFLDSSGTEFKIDDNGTVRRMQPKPLSKRGRRLLRKQ